MEPSKEELLKENSDLKKQLKTLEEKYKKETSRLRKNEDELRLRALFLEGIANSTVDGFLVVNPYGQKIFQNRRTIELWKIPQEVADDTQGIKQVEHVKNMVVDPKQFLSEIVYLGEHPDEKSRDELELVDGTILDRYSSPVIGLDGKNYGRIWTFHDITERKKIEAQLAHLNADKDRFISILAHDLRSPVANIVGLIQVLSDSLEVLPVEQLKEIVSLLESTAKKTHALLEDTLLWANLRSQNITFNPEKINLTEIIEEVTDILQAGAKLKEISINPTNMEEKLVFGDPYMLKAILRNLVSNAIKFTKPGGSIIITTLPNHENVEVTVADSGVGIPKEALEKLFDISTIQSTSGTANETGSGLGLMLCKEFAGKNGGKIWVESELNIGTKVHFTIPIEPLKD